MKLSNLRCLLVVASVATVTSGLGAAESKVEQAFLRLTADAREAVLGMTEGDRDAMETLRGNRAETRGLMARALGKGSPEATRDRAKTVFVALPPDLQLEILREVIASYPIGDPAFPFGAYVADLGLAEDFTVLIEHMTKYPSDGIKVRNLTAYMAKVDNPAAHDALLKLAVVMPGPWMNDPDVKRIVDRLARGNGSQSAASTDGAGAGASASSSGTPGNHASSNRNTLATTTISSPWLWAVGVAAAAAGILIALRFRSRR